MYFKQKEGKDYVCSFSSNKVIKCQKLKLVKWRACSEIFNLEMNRWGQQSAAARVVGDRGASSPVRQRFRQARLSGSLFKYLIIFKRRQWFNNVFVVAQ